MSKTKNKTSTEIRHLLGENNRLRKQNAQLKRMLEKYDQGPRGPVEEKVVVPEVFICGECERGELEVFEIIGRVYTTCPVCGDRKRVASGNGPA